MDESYRRTNDPSGLEVEPSTAGASGGRDHGRQEYWRDRRHDFVRVSFIAANGQIIQEMGQHNFPAALNANAQCPLEIRLELVHEDGCTQLLQQMPVECY